MGCGDHMDTKKWGWDLNGNELIPIMMDNEPAPDALLKMIHCNCGACKTGRCSCKKYGLECTAACGPCQENGKCENMRNEPLLDENED